MAKTEFKLKGLRKYGVAVSGLLVLALTTVASGEQIPYETTLSNNGTTHSYESSYLFDLFNILWRKSEIHYHHVWPVSSSSYLHNSFLLFWHIYEIK